MLCRITNRKSYRYFTVKAPDPLSCKMGFRIKHEPVNASMQSKTGGQQIPCATVCVGQARPDLLPAAIGSFEVQPYRKAAGRLATGDVENVCGDSAHWILSLVNYLFCLVVQVIGFLPQRLNSFSSFRSLGIDHFK
jgi:hypothetical protein